MTQQSARSCPKCGTAVAPGQRFCANCGTAVEADVYKPTERKSNPANASAPDRETQFTSPPPPPPLATFSQLSTPPQSYQQTPPPSFQPPLPEYQPQPGNVQPPPAYARPQKDSTKSVLGQIGCVTLAIILVAVGLCGGAGYLAYQFIFNPASQHENSSSYTGNNSTVSNNSTGANNGTETSRGTTTSAPEKVTFTHPLSFTYASVNVSILDVQQAASFSDDTDASQSSVVRLDVHEENTYTSGTDYAYNSMRLVLPDGTTIAPLNEKNFNGPDGNSSRQNWIDFPVPSSTNTNGLKLQVGDATKAQITIPLTDGANLSQYQPKTTTPNVQTHYGPTTWTITNATAQLSYGGKQADNRQMYIVVTFKIDNPGSQNFGGIPTDYIRLKSGNTTNPPDTNTVPATIAAGQTNVTAIATFIMPQSSTDFTLNLLASAPGFTDAPATSLQFTTK